MAKLSIYIVVLSTCYAVALDAQAIERYHIQPVPFSGLLNDQGAIATTQNIVTDGVTTGKRALLWRNGITTDLGALGTDANGNSNTEVVDINASGQVVGNSVVYDANHDAKGSHAFLWANGKMTDLGALGVNASGTSTSNATSINAVGQIVGSSTVYNVNGAAEETHAFLWTNGKMRDIAPIGDEYATSTGVRRSVALDINDGGQVLLDSHVHYPDILDEQTGKLIAQAQYRPLIWYNNNLTNLGAARSVSAISPCCSTTFIIFGDGLSINNSGVVLGTMVTENYYESHPVNIVSWQPDGSLGFIKNTHRKEGPRYVQLNNLGEVVAVFRIGTNVMAPRDFTAVVAYDGLSFQEIIPADLKCGERTALVDINDNSQIVGHYWCIDSNNPDLTTYSAYLYQEGIITGLNDLLPANSGWLLNNVYAINNVGQILASGTLNGEQSYALLTPITAWQWRFGVTSSGQASKALFAGGATLNQGVSFGTTFKATQAVDVIASIRPSREHVGKSGVIYTVALYNTVWFMKNIAGQWINWDGQIAHLVPSSAAHLLKAQEKINVAPQLKGLPGKFEVFVGYKANVNIHYNAQSFYFAVQ